MSILFDYNSLRYFSLRTKLDFEARRGVSIEGNVYTVNSLRARAGKSGGLSYNSGAKKGIAYTLLVMMMRAARFSQ